MLRRITRLQGNHILALDGEVGKLRDVYFDDSSWVVRYLIVDTGGWLSGRKVLIAPQAVARIDRELHTVSLSLTRELIQASPHIDTDKPVSRQHESDFNRYYGYPAYWASALQWGTGPMPPVAAPTASDLLELEERRLAGEQPAATHLRSTQEVLGYAVKTGDAHLGQVRNFLVDDETWAIRYLVLETGKWPFGRRVLIRRGRVAQLDWGSKSIEVTVTRAQIARASDFDPQNPPAGDIARALSRAVRSSRRRH